MTVIMFPRRAKGRALFYWLDGKITVPCATITDYIWSCTVPTVRKVNETFRGNVQISTVFLGIDYQVTAYGPPHLFETMIFGGPESGARWRYSSWDEAEYGHRLAVQRMLSRINAKRLAYRKCAMERKTTLSGCKPEPPKIPSEQSA